MNTTHTEILSALLDGEPVDPALLAASLEDADARAALVDFVRLREAARSDDSPLPASLQRLRQTGRSHRVIRYAAAAAVLVLMFVAGLLTPRPGRTDPAGTDEPPQPTRVEKFEPGVDWHSGN
jgi:hypothetical protein